MEHRVRISTDARDISVLVFRKQAINGILFLSGPQWVHWFHSVVISVDIKYLIGMDILGGKQNYHISFLLRGIKAIL